MRNATRVYVAASAAMAVAGTYAMYRSSAPVPTAMLGDAFILCGLAIAAEFLSYILPRGASGSMGFIPYLAAAIVVPGWPTVVGVLLVKSTSEIIKRREPIKATLNISSHVLCVLAAIVVFLALGGHGLSSIRDRGSLTHVTQVAGIAALVAVVTALLTNNLIVMGAIAVSSGRPLRGLVRENNRATVGLSVLMIPLVFVFAWVYTAFGAIAAATLWIPILGLRQFHSTNLELERTNEELLELMVKSIEARDPYTSGHSRRVQQFSLIIARALGLPEREIEQVGRAALLHDVGKIHEKYASVLTKQDKLTAEEWAIIKDHPVDGADLIATMTRLRDVVPSVRHHHENWDGTGYPDGLSGEVIPTAARIIRFADTIDAMTTERPYRGPLTEAQVRAEVVRCRGSQFDPQIADRLLASALWPSLFAPESNDRSIAPLAVVGQISAHQPRMALKRGA